MSTLINNATFFPEIDWSRTPSVRPDYRTERAESLDGAQDRLGLRSDPLVRQQWRIRVDGVAVRTELLLRVREASRSGRSGAPRWDRALTVSASSGTSLTVTGGEWTLAVGSFIAVPTADGLVAREIDAATESPAGTWTLTLDASVTAQVGMLAYPVIFGTPQFARLESPADGLALDATLTEPLGTGSLVNSDACTPPALEADTDLSFCQNDVGTDDPETCSGTNVASLTVDPWPQADDYTVEVADAATGPWSTHATGVASTLDVPRSLTAKFYRFVPQIGGTAGDPSAVAPAPATTIEGVMRAVQERYLATTDATHGHTPSPLVWPDRISDSASPGDYPAEGFYTDANVAANAATYVQAIAEAFNAPPVAWLDRYASDDDWTGLANVAAIPKHDTSTLMVPTTVSITAFNWTAKLFELAGCCCRLEYLVRETDVVDSGGQREGTALGKHADHVSELVGSTGFGTYQAYAQAAWQMAGWFDEGDPGQLTLVVPDLELVPFVGGPGVTISQPGLQYVCGTYGAAYPDSQAVLLFSWRAKLEADLAPSGAGSAQVFVRISGNAEEFPKPALEIGTLQRFTNLPPGGVVKTGYLTGTENPPPTPAEAGQITMIENVHHLPSIPFPMITDVDRHWQFEEAVTLWTRSHKRSAGHWTHYP